MYWHVNVFKFSSLEKNKWTFFGIHKIFKDVCIFVIITYPDQSYMSSWLTMRLSWAQINTHAVKIGAVLIEYTFEQI